MDYAKHFAEHVRITVLRLLAEVPDYRLNSSLLADGCDAMGLPVTRDNMRTQLAWLAEQGLIAVTAITEQLSIAKLTERGLEAAKGRIRVPGVRLPSP